MSVSMSWSGSGVSERVGRGVGTCCVSGSRLGFWLGTILSGEERVDLASSTAKDVSTTGVASRATTGSRFELGADRLRFCIGGSSSSGSANDESSKCTLTNWILAAAISMPSTYFSFSDPSFRALDRSFRLVMVSSSILASCRSLLSSKATANNFSSSSPRANGDPTPGVLASWRICTLRLISPTASRTAWLTPNFSPRSITFLAAPCIRASRPPGFCRNLAGAISGDLAPSVRCLRWKPRGDGVEGRSALGVVLPEAAGGDCNGDLPVYFKIRAAPPAGFRWSFRYMASSTNVCGPCGGSGDGYLRSSCNATV